MKNIIYLLILLSVSNFNFAQSKGKLEGVITDRANNQPLPGVNILLKGTYYGSASDFDGKYRIENINPGIYTVEVSFIGYKTMQFTGINIDANRTLQLNIKLEETSLTIGQDVVVVGEKPLVDVEETQSKKSLSREDIESDFLL